MAKPLRSASSKTPKGASKGGHGPGKGRKSSVAGGATPLRQKKPLRPDVKNRAGSKPRAPQTRGIGSPGRNPIIGRPLMIAGGKTAGNFRSKTMTVPNRGSS